MAKDMVHCWLSIDLIDVFADGCRLSGDLVKVPIRVDRIDSYNQPAANYLNRIVNLKIAQDEIAFTYILINVFDI